MPSESLATIQATLKSWAVQIRGLELYEIEAREKGIWSEDMNASFDAFKAAFSKANDNLLAGQDMADVLDVLSADIKKCQQFLSPWPPRPQNN